MLDVVFREDESRHHAGNSCENLALMRKLAIGLLKQEPEHGADEPGDASHEQRQQRENQRPGSGLVLTGARLHLVVTRGDCPQGRRR